MVRQGEYGRSDFGQGGLNDQLDADRLTEQIGLDREEIRWRKDFVGFGPEDVRRLESYQDVFAENAEQVADDFYENITQHEETVEVIGRSPKEVEQLKRTQSAYLTTLASGDYGEEYFRDRARIGKIHDLLDMPMKHYLGQYGVYYDLILPLVGDRLTESLTARLSDTVTDGGTVTEEGGNASTPASESGLSDSVRAAVEEEVDGAIQDILSILRIIDLDMQVVTDTYIHSYSQQLEEEISRNEQLMREVETDLQGPLEDLGDTSADVAEGATEISDAAGAQSGRIDEIAAEVSDLSATVEEVASTADQVETASKRAEQRATDGKEAADEAAAVMDEIGDAIGAVSADVGDLQARVEDIDGFVDAINGIAEQTNILALNASIEAARAGEAGEGFAVVADEIKALAQESQEHAQEIETMVEEIQADTADTVRSLDETTERVDSGIDRVQDAMENLTDIVKAIGEAADGISEVSDAADDQATSAEAVASMVDEVVEQAERVTEEVQDLAAANEEQASMVSEVERTVTKLADDQAAADGGVTPESAAAHADVTIPDDLPDGLPDFVVDMLSEEQLRAVARGELEPSDVL
jgi:methyl-accepting chemotaxis protein